MSGAVRSNSCVVVLLLLLLLLLLLIWYRALRYRFDQLSYYGNPQHSLLQKKRQGRRKGAKKRSKIEEESEIDARYFSIITAAAVSLTILPVFMECLVYFAV